MSARAQRTPHAASKHGSEATTLRRQSASLGVQEATPSFAARLVAWQRAHGRHDLPWQDTRDPYRIWLSEVMLQQTQVTTVLAYYAPFLDAFPDIATLASAPLDHVLARWSGLGYYRRARHLHAAAQCIVADHGGAFPHDVAAIAQLPGIGRSTAAAIAAFAFGTRGAILDGNVKRVLARHRGIDGYPGAPPVEAALWTVAETLLPAADVEAYTQGMMDLGATLCVRRNPQCSACPVATDCVARREGRIEALPAARPARVLPRRAVQMLLVEHAGEILLEKRAPTGVWGSLWSLPEVDPDDDARAACMARYGEAIARVERLGALEHAFTHYHLTIRPVRIVLQARTTHAETPGRLWLTRADAMHAALPSPVRRLLSIDLDCALPLAL